MKRQENEVRQDDLPQPDDRRLEWQRPELRRIVAGSAEIAPVNTADAVLVS